MPFKIGEIYTEVRAETGPFTKKMGEVKTSLFAVGSAAMVVVNQAVQLGSSLVRAAGRAAGALSRLVRDAARLGDSMAKSARRIGVTTETLSRYSFAAKLAGTTSGAVERAFKTLGTRANDVQDGLTETIRSFEKLGVQALDEEGNIRELDTLFLEVIDSLSKLENKALRNALAVELFGRSGLAMIPMLDQGTDALRRQLDEAESLGGVWSTETGRMAEDFQDAITRMSTAWEAFKRTFFVELAPLITDVLGDATTAWKAHRAAIEDAVRSLMRAGGAMARYGAEAVRGRNMLGQGARALPGGSLLGMANWMMARQGRQAQTGLIAGAMARGLGGLGRTMTGGRGGAAPEATGQADDETYRLERQAFWREAAVRSMWDAVDAERAWTQEIWKREEAERKAAIADTKRAEAWEARLDTSLQGEKMRAVNQARTVREQIAITKYYDKLMADRAGARARGQKIETAQGRIGELQERLRGARARPGATFTNLEGVWKQMQLAALNQPKTKEIQLLEDQLKVERDQLKELRKPAVQLGGT